MEYKYSVSSVKEFIGLLRQNLAQPLPLADFSSDELFYLPNLAQISTNGMKRGLDFIADRQNAITEENLHQLYQISSGDYLPDEDRLLPDHFYRNAPVYVIGGEESREGLPVQQLPDAMKRLVDFANAKDVINELHKAAILHFAFAYYHPYFDGNGRTARLLLLWYLV